MHPVLEKDANDGGPIANQAGLGEICRVMMAGEGVVAITFRMMLDNHGVFCCSYRGLQEERGPKNFKLAVHL